MAIKFETVKADDVLYSYHSSGKGVSRRMGNWEVRICEINHEEGWVIAMSLGRKRRMVRRQVERLRRTPGKTR